MPKSSFGKVLDRITRAATDELDRIERQSLKEAAAAPPYSPNDRSFSDGRMSSRDHALHCVTQRRWAAEETPKATLALVKRLQKHVPFIDAGFMTALDALKLENAAGLNNAITGAGRAIAAPGNARLHRERCREVNEENDGREAAESMFGLGKGARGRTTHPRSDSIDPRHFDRSRR